MTVLSSLNLTKQTVSVGDFEEKEDNFSLSDADCLGHRHREWGKDW